MVKRSEVETLVRDEATKAIALVDMLMEYKTDENPKEVPASDRDHFALFGIIEECFTEIMRILDRPEVPGVSTTLMYATELESHFRILRHQAGMSYFDRPAVIVLAKHLVDDFIETMDEELAAETKKAA